MAALVSQSEGPRMSGEQLAPWRGEEHGSRAEASSVTAAVKRYSPLTMNHDAHTSSSFFVGNSFHQGKTYHLRANRLLMWSPSATA